MPEHPLCPPHDLGPTPCEGFFYCPDPLALTDEQMNALFPLEQRIQFFRDIARTAPAAQPTQHPTPDRPAVRERLGNG
jgi:hypothetical protein